MTFLFLCRICASPSIAVTSPRLDHFKNCTQLCSLSISWVFQVNVQYPQCSAVLDLIMDATVGVFVMRLASPSMTVVLTTIRHAFNVRLTTLNTNHLSQTGVGKFCLREPLSCRVQLQPLKKTSSFDSLGNPEDIDELVHVCLIKFGAKLCRTAAIQDRT